MDGMIVAVLGLALSIALGVQPAATPTSEVRMPRTAHARGAGKAKASKSAAVAPAQPTAASRVNLRRSRVSGAGTNIASGAIQDLDSNTELRGQRWYGSPGRLGIADKMRRDPHVRQSIAYIVDPLVAGTWRFHTDGARPVDKEAAAFATWAFFRRLPWDSQILPGSATRYIAKGFDLLEITDDNVEVPTDRFPLHPGAGLGVLPTGMHEIPASTVHRWRQSASNPAQIAGIQQQIVGSDSEKGGFREISADRILRLTWEQEAGHFPGLAVLRSAYAPWKLKMAFQTLDAIRQERLAVPTPVLVASADASQEDIDAADTILAEMRSNDKGFLSLPNGYVFKWEGSGDGDSANTALAIERCNKDIAINVACGYMLLGLTGQSGSYALGATQQTQHHLTVDRHGRFYSSCLSIGMDGWSPVRRLIELNYGSDVVMPHAVVLNLPTRNWADIAKVVNAGVASGAITADDALEDALREGMQLPARDPASARKKSVAALEKKPQPAPDHDDTADDDAEDAA